MATVKDLYIDAMAVDASYKLKLTNFFSLFQDIASENAEEMGIGKAAITDKGLDWVVMRVKAEFYAPIQFGKTYELYTYPYDMKSGFIFLRNAGIRTKDKKYLAKLISMWGLIDHKTRKMLIKPNVPYLGEDFGDDPLPMPIKILEEDAKLLYSRQMRYSDTDLNGHVNNTRYIEMLSDVFDLEFYMRHLIKSVDLNYMYEIHDGDQVDVYASEDKTYIECRVENKIMFNAKLAFEEI